jgi:hypothetical protein
MYNNIFLGILIALFLIGMFLVNRVYKNLKSHHLATYKALGAPTLFLNHSMKSDALMIKFLLKRKYLLLNDKKLKRTCDILLLHMIIAWVLLFIYFFI